MLSESQIAQFRERGYVVVENLVDAATLAAVRNEYAALMDRFYAGWQAEGRVLPAGEDLSFWDKLDRCLAAGFDWYQPFDISLPHHDIREDTSMHFGPAVFNLVTHRSILDSMEALIGPEITSSPIQHVRIKPPGRAVTGGESRAHVTTTHWHQDKGVTLPEADDTEFVTVWLAVTDATVENCCLQVIPGRFQTMLPHHAGAQVSVADGFLPAGEAVPAPVRAGGAVIFHLLMPHASLPNTSDEYRWSFDLRYNVTGQPTGRSQFPEFIARSRQNPGAELRDWREWKAMWQRARKTLANTPHIPQHRWPAGGR